MDTTLLNAMDSNGKEKFEIRMVLSDAISLSVVSEAEAFSQTQCDVLINGNNTGIKVSGQVLEAAISVSEGRYLLFLTDDVIYEESLNITLIDAKLGHLESLDLGGQYATGTFEQLHIKQTSVNFRFIGDTTWTVEILTLPALRLPFTDPRGVTRPLRLKKYINISANPAPARADGSR
ncbi:hypothetical protein N5923_20870 [Erwiniaceae bacterium BAC15a-03b]|uniref:Uncharacterized protein n=1 Tax=Winslowiella arboricola TaxID=2978220 RepID=A0A9J6PR77_9GAMM|nr:hypothetical protein [Winslowiella arboricola]MCU5774902.1 hypothetical protein [Winslowiella arboricola]MCU5779946.1 hypothetical protein [Winslowiella arboricola]